MAMKDWKNQTSKTQRSMSGLQFINKKDQTQISISKWDYDEPPKNWAFYAHSKEEASRGYPSQKVGITKKEAYKLLKAYMRTH